MRPERKLACASAASSGSTPMTRAGRPLSLRAVATPLIRPPPPTGTRTVSGVRQVGGDFQAGGAGAGDDFFVVVGWDDGIALLAGESFGFRSAFRAGAADEDDFGAERAGALDLDLGGDTGHHDDRFCAEGAGGIGDALGVVAAGVGDDAAPALVIGERGDLVVGAAQFEGADGLEALRLEIELAARLRAGNQRRAHGDAAQARGGQGDVGESDHGRTILDLRIKN